MQNRNSISNNQGTPPSSGIKAFSLMEVVVLIALVGVLASVAVVAVSTQPVAVKNVKLASDVATLNHMVSMYAADGGSLAGLTSPQTVLDKMKRARPQTEWQRHTGASSGRLVDTRLRARVTAGASGEGLERARWNTQTQRFELTKGGGTAVADFYLDEALAGTEFGTDNRSAPNLKYNTSSRGWVWGGAGSSSTIAYATPGDNAGLGAPNPFNPGEATPAAPAEGGGGGGDDGGGGGGGGDDGSGAAEPAQLPKPNISPAGGTFAYAAFPSSASLSPNGAPTGASQLMYRKNSGAWTVYDGSPITLASTDKLEARNVSSDTSLYKNSNTNSGTYYRLISGFTGTGSGTWGNAAGGPNLVTTTSNGPDSSTFKHGNTKLDLGNGEFLDAGTENVLTFNRRQFDTITPNTWFPFGELTLLNGTTFYSSEAEGVTLSVNINLGEPAQTGVVHINLGLISTENSSDRQASADIVELRNPSTDFTVTVDGVTYRLELGWATLDPGAGVSQGNQFYVYEGSSAQAELRARFVSNK